MSVTTLRLYQKSLLEIPKLAWSVLRNLLCYRLDAVAWLQLRRMRRKRALERNAGGNERQSCCWQLKIRMMWAHDSRAEDYVVVLAQEACLEQSSRMQPWKCQRPPNDGLGLPSNNHQGRRQWQPQPPWLRP